MKISSAQWAAESAPTLPDDGVTDDLSPQQAVEPEAAPARQGASTYDPGHAAGPGAPGAGLANLPAPEHAAGQTRQLVASERNATIATPNSLATALSPERARALDAVAADFQAKLALARDNPARTGAGWVQVWVPNRGGATSAEPAGAAAAGGKQGGAMPSKPDKPGQAAGAGGQYVAIFSDSAFRDAYLNQGGGALQALAQAYGSPSVNDLLKSHPELHWTVLDISGADPFLRPALNGEGPPPAWIPPYSTQALMNAVPAVQAMMQNANAAALAQHQATQAALPPGTHPNATVETLRAIDAMISQPAHQWLLAEFGGTARSAAELDPAKVATYGLQRAQVMDQLERARAALGMPPPQAPFHGEAAASTEILAQGDALVGKVATEFKAYLQTQGIDDPERWEWGFAGQAARLHEVEKDFARTNESAQALARFWGYADGTALITARTEILRWTVNPQRRLEDAPGPTGYAMASSDALGTVDLLLSDPDNQALIREFGGPPPSPHGAVANEQVRLYGLTRYQAMTQLSTAMATVRQDYLVQLNNAQTDASNPAVAATLPFLKDGKFSVEAFTAWYEAQPGAANQAFTKLMGPMSTREVPDLSSEEAGRTTLLNEFALSPWHLTTSQPRSGETPYFVFQVRDEQVNFGQPSILSINPQAPPELNEPTAVGFDANLGWITSRQNIHHHQSTTGELLHTIVVVGIGTGIALTAGGEAAAYFGSTVMGAAAGAATSAAVMGAVTHNFSWKDVLTAGLTAGATAGISQGLASLGPQLGAYSNLVSSPTFNQSLTQGIASAAQGGSFMRGAVAGFASGLATEVGALMNAGINANTTMTPVEQALARTAVRALTSAIRVAGDPSNPSQAFAAAFVSDFVGAVVKDINFDKLVWGNGTPEQLSDAHLAARMKSFEDAFAAKGQVLTADEKASLYRTLLQDPNMTPEKYQLSQQRLVIAHASYTANAGGTNPDGPALPPGYTRARPGEGALARITPDMLDDQDSGFHAEIYRTPTGGYIVGYAGTEDLADFVNGNNQIVNSASKQYQLAAELARTLADELGPQLEGFTGHSLGGGLASLASAVTGRPATVFNAAGLSSTTINANLSEGQVAPAATDLNQHIVNFRVQDEVLTGLQQSGSIGAVPIAVFAALGGGNAAYVLNALGLAAPTAVGTQITIAPMHADGTSVGFFERNNLLNMTPAQLHALESLYPALHLRRSR